MNLLQTKHLAALDRRRGVTDAAADLQVRSPEDVLNTGLDLDLEIHSPAYVSGWLGTAVAAGRAQVTSLTVLISMATDA